MSAGFQLSGFIPPLPESCPEWGRICHQQIYDGGSMNVPNKATIGGEKIDGGKTLRAEGVPIRLLFSARASHWGIVLWFPEWVFVV